MTGLLTASSALAMADSLWQVPPDSVVEHKRREARALVEAQIAALGHMDVGGCWTTLAIDADIATLRAVLAELQ